MRVATSVRGWGRARIVLAACAAGMVLAAASTARAILPVSNASGTALYLRECAPCHGPTGSGGGPEAPSFAPPPRDLHAEFIGRYAADKLPERLRRSRLLIIDIDAEALEKHRKAMAEQIVSHLQRMQDVDWPLVRRGGDVYAERCETCHGPHARPPLIAGAAQPTDVDAARKKLRPEFQKAHGDADLLAIARGKHAAVSGFEPVASEADAKALLAYLRLLSTGFVRYSLWCAGCHGDDGGGKGVFASGMDDPKMAIDRAYLARTKPDELRRKVLHLIDADEPSMPHFQRDLSAGQARAILAALQASAPAASGKVAATPAARPASSPAAANASGGAAQDPAPPPPRGSSVDPSAPTPAPHVATPVR